MPGRDAVRLCCGVNRRGARPVRGAYQSGPWRGDAFTCCTRITRAGRRGHGMPGTVEVAGRAGSGGDPHEGSPGAQAHHQAAHLEELVTVGSDRLHHIIRRCNFMPDTCRTTIRHPSDTGGTSKRILLEWWRTQE